ncbi:hypothetical protein ACFYTQ_31865 [Nocardia sp. NPDC004068]|uniref:hypothetical protein n=1 Tax=Nocardia sp. NPDC004068 TaxID=3364303 RepID=UPI0036832C4E
MVESRALILLVIITGIAAIVGFIWLGSYLASEIKFLFHRYSALSWIYWLTVPALLLYAYLVWAWVPLVIAVAMPIIALFVDAVGNTYDEAHPERLRRRYGK